MCANSIRVMLTLIIDIVDTHIFIAISVGKCGIAYNFYF